MKKSHIWDTYEILEVKCPYCRKINEQYCGCSGEEDTVKCHFCEKEFELGKQK
jgi:phage FluMu protein Com